MDEYIAIILFFVLIGFEGRNREKKHYQSIREREILYIDLPILNEPLKAYSSHIKETKFISSTVVLSDDFFKYFWALLKTTFGGAITPYELVMDRARREAVLRLKEACSDADAISNIQLCHCSISNRVVEVIAYGTAVYWHEDNIKTHGN